MRAFTIVVVALTTATLTATSSLAIDALDGNVDANDLTTILFYAGGLVALVVTHRLGNGSASGREDTVRVREGRSESTLSSHLGAVE